MTTSSGSPRGRNGELTTEDEAQIAHAAVDAFVFAFEAHPSTLRYANRINHPRHLGRRPTEANRVAEAKRLARQYVPRGSLPHKATTALLLYLADVHRDPPEYTKHPAQAVRAALLELARRSFVVDGEPVRQRRAPPSYWLHLKEAADMIVRRGTGRCMNLACGSVAGRGSDYCGQCEHNDAVQRGHDAARKRMGELWSVAAPLLCERLAQERYERGLPQRAAGAKRLAARQLRDSRPPIPSGSQPPTSGTTAC